MITTKRFIALLRGINVSGVKKIKMADLKLLLSTVFTDVSTYIQTGNIIFTSSTHCEEELAQTIKELLLKEYGFDVPTYVCSEEKMHTVFENIPFESDHTYVIFLSQTPKSEDIINLMEYQKEPEKIVLDEDTLYIYLPNGAGRTKLTNNFIESKLKLSATTRNYKTVQKLTQLMQG